MYAPEGKNGSGFDENGHKITEQEKLQRKAQQSAAFDQIKDIYGTYGDQTSMMIGARQDTRASTGEDAVAMRQMVLDATDGGKDQLGMTAFLGDLRNLSKEAKRVDKSGIGFSSDIGVMETMKAEKAATGQVDVGKAREQLLLGALEKSSASEIATMHDKGMREMQEILKKRIEDARDAATQRQHLGGVQVTPETIMQDAEYQTAIAQAANLYDAFQYATPKNMEELAPFMNDASITASGKSVLQDVIEMRGKDTTFSTFAANRRDYGASEAEAAAGRGGGQPRPGAFGTS